MEQPVQLRCKCGHVQGVAQVSADSGTHIVCYCDDCQAFANHLQRADVMDAAGGTSVFQMAPSRLRITEGRDAVACLRLSPKGMLRWYTSCCGTPLANTVSGRVPFVGLITAGLDFERQNLQRDEVLGPPSRVLGRHAIGGLPPDTHASASPMFVARVASFLLRWWLTGKGKPSPFFDEENQPRVRPTILTVQERDALRPASGQASTT